MRTIKLRRWHLPGSVIGEMVFPSGDILYTKERPFGDECGCIPDGIYIIGPQDNVQYGIAPTIFINGRSKRLSDLMTLSGRIAIELDQTKSAAISVGHRDAYPIIVRNFTVAVGKALFIVEQRTIDMRPEPQALWIPGPLPGFNELERASKADGIKREVENTHGIKLPNKGKTYTEKKRYWTWTVFNEVRKQGIKPVKAAQFEFIWWEKDRRRDPDNIIAGQKVVFDGLEKAGIIKSDNWECVKPPMTHNWKHCNGDYKDKPGVVVLIRECQ
jgi:Holliday junction resolvase RusA-like endonuclease